MKIEHSHKTNQELFWHTLKLSVVIPVVFYLLYCLSKYHSQPFPVGVCTIFDCSMFCSGIPKWLFVGLLVSFAWLYIVEKAMLLSLVGLSICSIITLTLEESNGNPAENGIISLLFIAQLIAYILHWINTKRLLEQDRVQFSIQIVAAVYVLSAVSKLSTSGSLWFMDDAPNFILEIYRVYNAKYAATGLIHYQETAGVVASFFLNHVLLLRILLFFALVIELFSFLMIINSSWAIVYGLLLLSLHLGIYLIIDVTFPTIMIPMLVVTINPLYWILQWARKY